MLATNDISDKAPCSPDAAPRVHKERSPLQPGQGLQLPLAAPTVTPLASLTLTDELQLLPLSSHEHPGDPYEHRACQGPWPRS